MARDGHNLHHHSDGEQPCSLPHSLSLSLSLSFIRGRGQNLFFVPHRVFGATISLCRKEPLLSRWSLLRWTMSFLMMSYGDGLHTTGASASRNCDRCLDGHLALAGPRPSFLCAVVTLSSQFPENRCIYALYYL